MLCTAILWYLPLTLWLELEINTFCPSFDKITKINTVYFVLTYPSPVQVQQNSCHFGDNQITMIFNRKKVPLQFSRRKTMELVLQISDIPSLIFGDNKITSIFAQKKFSPQFSPKYRNVLNVHLFLSLITFSQKDGIHLHFRKWWWKKSQKLVRKWILYPTSTGHSIYI